MNSTVEQARASLIIVTHRDIFQWVNKEKRLEGEYQERSAVVIMSPGDMKMLGIEEGATIRLRNAVGAIVVRTKLDSNCPQGFGFMPISPYSSRLTIYDTSKARLPGFKRIEVLAEPCEDAITPVSELQ